MYCPVQGLLGRPRAYFGYNAYALLNSSVDLSDEVLLLGCCLGVGRYFLQFVTYICLQF